MKVGDRVAVDLSGVISWYPARPGNGWEPRPTGTITHIGDDVEGGGAWPEGAEVEVTMDVSPTDGPWLFYAYGFDSLTPEVRA